MPPLIAVAACLDALDTGGGLMTLMILMRVRLFSKNDDDKETMTIITSSEQSGQR